MNKLTYDKFYHYVIQSEAKIRLHNRSENVIYTGKAFLIPDETWLDVKSVNIVGAGYQDNSDILEIYLNSDYEAKEKRAD